MHGRNLRQLGLLLISGLLLSSCLAVAAGAGAGAAVAWTQRGASSVVEGSVEQVFQRSTAVFQEMGIGQTGQSTEDSGRKRKLTGTKGDLEVTVELSRASETTTSVEVYAHRSPVEWEKDFARDVLSRIVQRRG